MKQLILGLAMAALLTGCISKHECLSGDHIDLPIDIDRFTRRIDTDDSWYESISLKPECLAYFKAYPDVESDTAKGTVFPIIKLKSELVRNQSRYEYDADGSGLLGLWFHLDLAIAFDSEGQPTGVMHAKCKQCWGMWSSLTFEGDFSTKTRAGRHGYLFNAFGTSRTHKGKKYTYVFWIPFKHSSPKTDTPHVETVEKVL